MGGDPHPASKQRVPEPRVKKVRAALPVPPDGRGVLVDSGEALRAIVTANPIGERLVEVRIGAESSFDAWVYGEWVREVLVPQRRRGAPPRARAWCAST